MPFYFRKECPLNSGYLNIIDQALRLRLKDETSVILSDLYLQILQYIEMHKTTLTDIIMKWHTEFGHLNRGDMLTSEQHRCSNEKKKF
ncbi:hypothetical protein CG414_26990 [Shigella sonnei]|nr:hypothetical protein CG414_26990 [Shigella sonnei]